MARIDSLLSIAISQGANELRIGSNREPCIFAFGTPLRIANDDFVLPEPPIGTLSLRYINGHIWRTESLII